MMFNVPVIGGSTGHAVGATLIAILLGPWAAVIAISIALVVQAGLFGDGGITALAANCFTMAVVMPFAGYYVYRLLAGDRPSPARRLAAGGAGGYVGITAGAVVAGVLFGIQPYLAHTATGQALYAPYRLDVAVPAMALEHLAFFGPIEALVTVGVLAALARTQPELLATRPAARPLRWLWAGLAALLLLTPLGALAPGTAWGEWSGDQLKAALGYVPGDLEKLGGTWTATMPDYSTPGIGNTLVGYLLAGAVGVVLVVGLAWGAATFLARRRGPADRDDPARRAPACPRRSWALAGAQDRRRRRALRHRRPRERGARRAARPAAAPGPAGQARDAGAVRRRHEPRPLHLGAAGAGRPHRRPRGGLARPGPLVRAQGLALRRPAGVPRRAALGPLLVHPGEVVVQVGPFAFTEPGLLGLVTLVLRVVAAAGFALLIMWTMRWSDLLRALTALRLPDVVVATLAMTHRQILTLLRTVEQTHLARESRTLTRGGARENREWVTERMAFVVRKSLKTADDVYDAMLARGYTGAMPSLRRLRVGPADWAWLAASVAVCAVVLAAGRGTADRPADSGAGAAGAAQPDFVLRGVRHEYRPGEAALAGVDLTVRPGEHVAVVGANGSGKSTLLKMLDGLVFPSAGEILAFGAPLTEDALEDPAFRRDFRARVGFVFQDADVQLFCSDVRDELAFGPLQLGLPRHEVESLVAEVAEHLRIDKLLDRPPYSLSGGEKKRVAIAAIVAMHPRVLLLDEPTSALDPRSQVWLLDVLDEWKREGRTVVMATHDLSAAAEAADRIVVLSEDHAVVADGEPSEVLTQRDLLLSVNLIHEHTHRHASTAHRHAHAHGPGADPLSVHLHVHEGDTTGAP